MSEDSEELSQVFEEEDDIAAKKVYESKQLTSISNKLEQKQLDDPEIDPMNFEESRIGDISEEGRHDADKEEQNEQVLELHTSLYRRNRTHWVSRKENKNTWKRKEGDKK